jgi:threonine/homoserine/homoserine lactone efflux protein
MSNLFLFLKALGFGIALAAPVGPIAILCVRRTLTDGFAAGLVTGMGAATADGLYAALAAFGLSSILHVLMGASPFMQFGGGIFLCYIGVRLFWVKTNVDTSQEIHSSSHLSNYIKTLLLTLANPLTVVIFLGLVSVLEIDTSPHAAFILTIGIFLGSVLWHLLLVSGFSIARTFLKPKHFTLINYLSGLLLAGLGTSILIP